MRLVGKKHHEKKYHGKRPVVRVFCLAASPLVLLLAVQVFFSPGGARPTTVSPQAALANGEPRALIKSIVVGGVDRLEASVAEVGVIRAATSATEAARGGMLLFAGDEVRTGGNAQVVLLFLDDPVVRDNEVFLDVNTRVQIGSLFARAGKILAKVKGLFKTKTTKVQLGVVGTEYELIVSPDGSAVMTVIDGEVEVMKGNFSPLGTVREPIDDWGEKGEANFVRAGFQSATPRVTPRLYEEFEVNAGQVKLFEGQYTLTNRCGQRHLFQIQSPPNLGWVQLPGGDRLEIGAGQARQINFAIRIDATSVPVGVYRGEIKAPCLDCEREPGCTLGGLFLRVEIKVVAPNGGQTTGASMLTARKLETVTLTSDETLSKSVAAGRVDSALRWTDNVILAAQPTYPARAVIPRFASTEERSQAFREARRKAVLTGDAESQQTLGDVYLDWGEGARALEAYEKSSQSAPARQSSPELLTGRGEALRLTGRLGEAEAELKRAIDANGQWGRAWNALGNVYLDQANVARDQQDTNSARGYAERARDAYLAASQSPPLSQPATSGGDRWRRTSPAPSPRNDNAWQAVTQSNLGEVYAVYGEIAQQQGRPDEARREYETAAQIFGEAARIDPAYPFATDGLGRAFRGQGNVALSQGDRARALASYGRSEEWYKRAIGQHRDLASAYVGLGRVYEETGRVNDALNSYLRANKTRPDQPESYYRLAVLLSSNNGQGTKQQPAAYAQTYLKLERPAFKGGEKGRNATVVASGGSIATATPTPPPFSATPTPTLTPLPTPPVTATPIPAGPPVRVPGIRGDRLDAAIREITGLGFKYRLVERPSCDPADRVRDQDPRGDKRAPAGSVITIYVAALEESAVTVPPVEGQQRGEAESVIREAGLNVGGVETQQTDNEPEGKVLDQRPDSGGRLRRGCPVRLTLAIPVIRVTVPRFIGLAEADARQRLPRFSGDLLRGSITYRESRLPPGTVIAQSPSPGERVPVGTRVDLVIAGSGRQSEDEEDSGVIVPQVTGRSPNDASAIIRRAGLVPVFEGEDGDVYAQTPPAGTRVKRGTTVKLSLGFR